MGSIFHKGEFFERSFSNPYPRLFREYAQGFVVLLL